MTGLQLVCKITMVLIDFVTFSVSCVVICTGNRLCSFNVTCKLGIIEEKIVTFFTEGSVMDGMYCFNVCSKLSLT